ncbi:odorant receptor Or2-like [Polyergus mexicanus]|uniref:odorant receptor Or2-like n=1 Tax=Polyergus mexicanus TaxID=615972 RepID=UPI0038B4AC15
MKHKEDYYYDINRRFLSIVGQWPYQKPKARLFSLAFLLICLVNTFVTQIAKLLICEDEQCIFETLPTHILMWNILVKVLTFRFNNQKIKNLTDQLFANWDIFETQEEREIMKKYAENGRRYVLIYSSYLYITAVSFGATSLWPRIMDAVFPLNTSRPIMLIWPAYYFVDEEKYYYYIFCDMLIILMICLMGLIAHDCMFFTYINHVCGLFAVVGFRFGHMTYKCNIAERNLMDFLDDVYHKDFVSSIHVHRKALQFTKLIESIFSISFAIQLTIVTVAVSITLLQVSTQLHLNIAEATRYFLFIVAQLYYLFCFSLQGQKLIDHSLDIRDKIYNNAWYEIPVKRQKMFLIVMRRGIEASTVTACQIYVYSLQNFTTILQAAMSYFTVLASFNE